MKKGIFLLLWFITFSLSATTYYVATNGNNSNPGTLASPFLTFQKGISVAHAGDTVYFRGGTYDTNYIINYYPGAANGGYDGTAENPVCFFNYPGETPIFDFTNQPIYGTQQGLICRNVDYAYFYGLTFRNIITSDSEPVAVDGDAVIMCYGVYITNSTNITFENCKVHNITGSGFKIYGGDRGL